LEVAEPAALAAASYASSPAPIAVAALPAAAAGLQPTVLGERWAGLVAQLNQRQAVTALARELAMQAQLIDAPDGAGATWRLRVERESLRTPALRDKLQAALAEALNLSLTLELEAGTVQDSPARRDAAERQRLQQQAEQIIHNDPLVQDLMAQFTTARIVPGSVKPLQAAGERP
jgi:DNA polymerase-3 subunit gamma/tau